MIKQFVKQMFKKKKVKQQYGVFNWQAPGDLCLLLVLSFLYFLFLMHIRLYILISYAH